MCNSLDDISLNENRWSKLSVLWFYLHNILEIKLIMENRLEAVTDLGRRYDYKWIRYIF